MCFRMNVWCQARGFGGQSVQQLTFMPFGWSSGLSRPSSLAPSQPGFSRDDFHKVYKWIEGLLIHNEQNEAKKISPEEAQEKLSNSGYAAAEIGVDPEDVTGLQYGMTVNVTTNDEEVLQHVLKNLLIASSAKPGRNSQIGKLIGLRRKEIVIENGIRMHFPRIG